jgi:muramoyltetrapeptide carboxypeptidase
MTGIGLPAPLRPGDRVRLAAASSALDAAALSRLEAGIAELERWGLVVEPHGQPLRRWGHLAGDDAARSGDLRQAETAPLLACIRGGWGAARLLERGGATAASGRWLLGFSDVTSLLWARLAAGLAGAIHGPMLTSLAAEPDWSRERLRDLLFGRPLPPLTGESWTAGTAEGPLLVGNLTVATHLLGTTHLPALRGAVLVLEDVGEAPYRLDRMLTHWRLCGALQQLGGIGFGQFSGCDDPDGGDGPESQCGDSAEAVLRERTADLGIPVLAGLPVGHVVGNAALPLGVRARLDASSGRLELLAD